MPSLKIRIATNAAAPAMGEALLLTITFWAGLVFGDFHGQTGRHAETGTLEDGLEAQTRPDAGECQKRF